MKKNVARLLVALLLAVTVLGALASCGIVVSGEYRFGMAVVETATGEAAAAVIIDSSDKIALARIDAIDSKKGTAASHKALDKDADAICALERELVGKNAEAVAKLTDNADYIKAVGLAIADAKSAETFKSTVDHLAISLTISARLADDGVKPAVVVSSEALSRAYRVAEKTVFYDPTPHDYKLGVATVKTDKGEVGASVIIDEAGRIALVRIDELDFSYGKTDSKKTQGDSYGMLSDWGSKLAEWDDQIAHLEKHLIGKDKNTLAEVEASNGKTSDVDILAGCTIGVSNYITAVAAAIDNASGSTEVYDASCIEISLSLSYTSVLSGGSYAVSAEATAVFAEQSTQKSVSSIWTAPAEP